MYFKSHFLFASITFFYFLINYLFFFFLGSEIQKISASCVLFSEEIIAF